MSDNCSVSQWIPSGRTLYNGYMRLQKGACVFGAGVGLSMATGLALTSLGVGVGTVAPAAAGLVVSQLALRCATRYLPESWQEDAKFITNFLLVSQSAALIGVLVSGGRFLVTVPRGAVVPADRCALYAAEMRSVFTGLWNGVRSADGIGAVVQTLRSAHAGLARASSLHGHVDVLAMGIHHTIVGLWYLGPPAVDKIKQLWGSFNNLDFAHLR